MVIRQDAYGEYTCLLTKYTDPNAQGNGANVSIPLIRYTDAMLIYSEACARVANAPTTESIEMLNQLRDVPMAKILKYLMLNWTIS